MNPTFKITMENGGVISGELYPEKAPQSVYNFIDREIWRRPFQDLSRRPLGRWISCEHARPQ